MKKIITAVTVAMFVCVMMTGTAFASAPTARSYFSNSTYNKSYTDTDGLKHTMTVTWVGEQWNKIGTVMYYIYFDDVYKKGNDTYIDSKSTYVSFKDARPKYPTATKYSVYRVNWYADGHSKVIFDYRTTTATPKPTVKPTVKPTAKPTHKPTARPTIKPTVKPTRKPTATVKATATPAAITATASASATQTTMPTPNITPAATATPALTASPYSTTAPVIAPVATIPHTGTLHTVQPADPNSAGWASWPPAAKWFWIIFIAVAVGAVSVLGYFQIKEIVASYKKNKAIAQRKSRNDDD